MKSSRTILFLLSLLILLATACDSKESKPIITSAPVPAAESSTLVFKSDFGYTLAYPSDWIVDDSMKKATAEFISEPSGKAYVAIQTTLDPRLTEEGGSELVLADIKSAFEHAPDYYLAGFELDNSSPETSESYFASGYYSEAGEKWLFKEIGSFSSDGTIMTFRANARSDFGTVYGPIAEDIIFSFKPTK